MASRKVAEKHNPFQAFVRGYFGEDEHGVGEKILNRFWEIIGEMPRYGSLSFMEYLGEMSHRTASDIMEWLMEPYNETEFAENNPLPYGPGPEYRGHVAKFREDLSLVMEQELRKRGPQPAWVDLALAVEKMKGV